MKLIDLLIQELPKRGGWPEGKTHAWQDNNTEIRFSPTIDCDFFPSNKVLCEKYRQTMVFDTSPEGGLSITRTEYQSALAASQKPAWNGEGLPPVECECEWRDTNAGWLPVTIKYISEQIVVMASPTNLCGVQELTEIAKDIICDKPEFRPLRTEADKRREIAIDWIVSIMPTDEMTETAAGYLYDAIAAGKIPGVKMDD